MANEAQIPLEHAFARIGRRASHECWPFTGKPQKNGYGYVRAPGVRAYVHRVILTHTQGPPPTPHADGRHICGNKLCGNPTHLAWGTRADNEADKVVHGRSNRGERQGQAKLTVSQVREIRRRAPTETYRALAAEFGVHPWTIRAVVVRKNWAWLP